MLTLDVAVLGFESADIERRRHLPAFGIISLWKKSLYGQTLTDIKSDPDMVGKFAVGMNTLIRQILGNSARLVAL